MIIKESLESGSQISVDRATRLLGVSRCGFYKWSGKGPVKNEDIDVRDEIQKVSLEYPSYGYRRILTILFKPPFYITP
jgi:ACT domain-containing protein